MTNRTIRRRSRPCSSSWPPPRSGEGGRRAGEPVEWDVRDAVADRAQPSGDVGRHIGVACGRQLLLSGEGRKKLPEMASGSFSTGGFIGGDWPPQALNTAGGSRFRRCALVGTVHQ